MPAARQQVQAAAGDGGVLTTVGQPLEVVGAHMVRVLYGRLDGESPVNIEVPTQLVVRGSP